MLGSNLLMGEYVNVVLAAADVVAAINVCCVFVLSIIDMNESHGICCLNVCCD